MDAGSPTFPLPPAELRREKRRAFFTSKLVWIPLLALAVVGVVVGVPAIALVPLLILALFVLALIWQARIDHLHDEIVGRIVARSNREQDNALVERIHALREAGQVGYAVTLGKFLEAKQRLEHRLHADDADPTPAAREIERLADAICLGVADAFDEVIDLESSVRALDASHPDARRLLRARQREHLGRIIDAYKVLKAAANQLDELLRGIRLGAIGSEKIAPTRDSLALAMEALSRESRIAAGTQARTARDAG